MVKKLPVPITEEEFGLLISKTRSQKHKVAFLLGYGAGLRVSEVVALKPERVNFKEKTILVLNGKGGKDRTVPLPKGFREAFIKFLPFNVTTRALQKAFFIYSGKAGIKKYKPTASFHSLRHGFATQLAKKGVPVHHIRTLMGHSNISTTNVYLEANPMDALKSYEDKF